jgi:hypothetical protein
MQCFVHPNLNAAGICKECGRAMCADCVSFGGHSGLCAACRKEVIESALQKNRKTKKTIAAMVIIFSVFILAGSAVCYFFPIWPVAQGNPIIFVANAAIIFFLIYLKVHFKHLSTKAQEFNANLAQISLILLKSLAVTGIINPLNPYQDVEACKPRSSLMYWLCSCGCQNPATITYCAECDKINPSAGAQMTFIESDTTDIPVYAMGSNEQPPNGQHTNKEEPVHQPQDQKISPSNKAEELEVAANKLMEEDIFEGQITFKEVLEQIIAALNMPLDLVEPAHPKSAISGKTSPKEIHVNPERKNPPAPHYPRVATRPMVRKPKQQTTVKKQPGAPTRRMNEKGAKPIHTPPPKQTPETAKHSSLIDSIDALRSKAMVEKDRLLILKEINKLRNQINELYKRVP